MLRVEHLGFKLNGKSIINDLSFQVNKGEIYGMLGENGTGKTTVAYLIMGISNYKPTEGRLIFEGQDIADLSVFQRARKGISLTWQEPARIEGLTVKDYLKLSGHNLGIEQIGYYLEIVGMEPAQYLDRAIDSTLSGGERKRVELASVLAMQPKLAILDEPDSGIDIISLPIILNSMVEMNKQGSSILLITHNEKAAEIAHRVSVLCAGGIIKTGAPAETCSWFKDNCRKCLHINKPTL